LLQFCVGWSQLVFACEIGKKFGSHACCFILPFSFLRKNASQRTVDWKRQGWGKSQKNFRETFPYFHPVEVNFLQLSPIIPYYPLLSPGESFFPFKASPKKAFIHSELNSLLGN
jgi:hypothetical protein